MSFLNTLENNINEINNLGITENGAIGFKSTGKALLDMNFNVPKYRKANASIIIEDFHKAYSENELLAILWMFFARDVRGGLGERRLFRILFSDLCKNNTEAATTLLRFIPEYGRWDDIIEATYNTPVWDATLEIIKNQLAQDKDGCQANKNVSLLAKWLPSERASSKKTITMARIIAKGINMPIKEYNRLLVALRKKIDIVESKMSAKEWSEIDYSAVPSGANLLYKNAFLRNDEERRRAYLESLQKGETKINSSTLFPHQIVNKYTYQSGWHNSVKDLDIALEEMWKALPDVEGLDNTIVVADGSGSMTCRVDGSNSSVTALDVANALAIYTAQHCKGEFKNKYITFSHNPQFVNLNGKTLRDNIKIALQHDEMANTNVEGVFNIILDTAKKSNAKQEDIPNKIIIISDMEFDRCARTSDHYNIVDDVLFKQIEKRYAEAGYKLPRLVFWNVNSRTGTIPVKENDLGVTLVSGYSLGIFKMVQDGELDPYKNLVKTLISDRYNAITLALQG